ncbi:hypothetical protein BDZ91DRAFT_759372 [Kalaharituber pfeilii]|nr:hypothetical protein BDZ91DRAFT_759372 [Kalaharituber pfeilii]
MAAAEYYGYQPDYNDENGRRSPLPVTSPDQTNYDVEHGGQRPGLKHSASTASSIHNPYLASSAHDDLQYPYGAQSASQHTFDTSFNSHLPQRESTTSLASSPSKQYPDPYAEDIPLASRPANMDTSTSYPLDPSLSPPENRPTQLYKARTRRPWFCWILAVAQIGVFVGELIRNAQLTGSPIAIKPSFNPMIGPSPYVQINMGGRYVLCMRYQADIWEARPNETLILNFPCPWATTNDANCTLAQHCGFSGVPSEEEIRNEHKGPNQWYRFILPMFLHAGLIHIAFNMLLQLRLGADMERDIGPLRFGLVYFASGIFGFILGGNFSPSGVVSTGASGCLFGILALVLLDLFYTWGERTKPWKDFGFLMIDIVISFVLGLLPGLDNFAHIGGFVMGIMLGLTVLHSPAALRRRIGDGPPYSPMSASRRKEGGEGGFMEAGFLKDPVGFFKGRKGLWWMWWGVRAGMLACAVAFTIVLLTWFYGQQVNCSWCKYLSCLPVLDWCEIGYLRVE